MLLKNQTEPKQPNQGRGGYRPGGGRPKGSLSPVRQAQLRAEATLKELAAQHTSTALETLVAIYKDVGTPPAARVSAIKELLDRGHGKPPQAIVGDPSNPIQHAGTIKIMIVDPRSGN